MGTPTLQLWEILFYYFLGNILPFVFSDLFSEVSISKFLDEFCNILIFSIYHYFQLYLLVPFTECFVHIIIYLIFESTFLLSVLLFIICHFCVTGISSFVPQMLFINYSFFKLIFGCIVFAAFWALSLVLGSGGYSLLQCLSISFGGFSCCRVQALGWAGFSSCSMWAQQQRRVGFVTSRHVGSFQTRDQTHVPCIVWQILVHSATRKVPPITALKSPSPCILLTPERLFTSVCIFLTRLQVFITQFVIPGLLFILRSETLNILWKIVGVEYWFVKSMSRCSSRTLVFHWAPTIANVGRAFLCHHLSLWARHSPDAPLWSVDGWTGPGCAG